MTIKPINQTDQNTEILNNSLHTDIETSLKTDTDRVRPELPQALIIESDCSFSTLFHQALSLAGYAVEVIADGKEALAHLTRCTPHLLLLDLNLPGAMGDEIVETVRKNPSFGNTRIILVTADARVENHIENQVDIVLIKPIQFSTLTRLATRFNPRPLG
ncbi:MAG: DNA-binding response OmpR family regulator [Cellvibrionaceae bacterium]|jgi:DNA-binding response OmpR family regulator